MRTFLLSVILLVSVGATACRENSRPTASPPTSPPASKNSLPKIVAFGDSLTAGLGLSQSENFPALLQKRLEADGLQYEVVNAGVSGDTSAGGLRRLDWAMEGDVKIVILELGANDILRGQPISQMKKNLSEIIERLQARDVSVLLAGMEAPTNAGSDYRKEAREAFQELADEHDVPLIPFLLEGVGGVPSLNQRDGIHPNAEGTKAVAEIVYKHLRPLLEEL